MSGDPMPDREQHGQPIRFEPADRPLLSVVMVTFGAWPWARRSLAALAAHTEVPFEVIVVDNASPDGTADRLGDEVRGATIVRNETNVGFGAGSNLGALHARGRFLCLLNSDAMVRPGWLGPLLEALDPEDVAAAVPCLLEQDGTVQEAGSVLASDGATFAYGRGTRPEDPAVRFPRRVDYGSAACMVLERAEFAAVGGFHPAYGIGYCEDVDLCLELASRGRWTVYEPRSRVVHVGAASSDHARAGRRMATNRAVLRRRWPDELARRPPLDDLERFPHRLVGARDAMCRDRILVLTAGDGPEAVPPWVPVLGRRLLPGGRVSLAHGGDLHPSAVDELVASGVEVAPTGADALEGWLRARLFHDTVAVAVGPAAAARFARVADEAEPQALPAYAMWPRGTEFVPLAKGAAGLTEARRAEVAWIRRSEAVICARPAERRLVEELAPGTRVLPAPPVEAGSLERWLDGLLAPLGVDPVARSTGWTARGPSAAAVPPSA